MKATKKLLALLLALTMVFGLATTAFAAVDGKENLNYGTITINNPAFDTEYTAYRLLDLESFSDPAQDPSATPPTETESDPNGRYSYKLNADWAAFFGYEYVNNKWSAIGTPDADAVGKDYIQIDEHGLGYVKWTGNYTDDPAAFAKAALKWAEKLNNDTDETNNIPKIANEKSMTKEAWESDPRYDTVADNTVLPPLTLTRDEDISQGVTAGKYPANPSGTDFPLGYYLVDTNLGALCSLGTTDNTAEIEEKNEVTTEEKLVKEDSSYGKENDADIGDTVDFQVTITAQKGAENYLFHDQMDKGLTYTTQSVDVYFIAADDSTNTEHKLTNGTAVAGVDRLAGVTEFYDLTESGDALVHTAAKKDIPTGFPMDKNEAGQEQETCTCDFHVSFKQPFLDKLDAGDKLILKYKAVVNENAEITTVPNENRSILDYGKDRHTPMSDTKTRTYEVNVLKYFETADGDDEDDKPDRNPLAGAKFVLYKEGTGTDAGKKLYLKVAYDTTDNVWRPVNNTPTDQQWEAADDSNGYIDQTNDSVLAAFTDNVMDSGHNDTTDGMIKIKGLDSGTYYLKEILAPKGYNKLPGDIKIVIEEIRDADTNEYESVSVKYGMADVDGKYPDDPSKPEGKLDPAETGYVIPVLNDYGREMPRTGGMGTTLFYVFGGLLTAAAVVLLITKKRVNG